MKVLINLYQYGGIVLALQLQLHNDHFEGIQFMVSSKLLPYLSLLNISLFAVHQGTGRRSESPTPGGAAGSPYPPRLNEAQLWAIEKVATKVARLLPTYEAKSVNMKKDISIELQVKAISNFRFV